MPTIAAVPQEQAPAEVKDIYEKLIGKHGKMPAFFANMAHRPAVLKAFLPLYGAIINEGTVEPKYKELAYLKASLINSCEYCHRAHSASAKKAGLTEDQIKALAFFQRSPLFDEKEKATILYAERVTRGASAMRAGSVQDLRKHYSDDQIVELTLAVCMANFTNRFNDAMEATPDLG